MKWDAGLYDNRHDFVSKYGEDVVGLLNPQPGEHILDAGCGTGDLTKLISAAGSIVEGVDLSPAMIEQAKGKFPELHFEVADLAKFEKKNAYDAIFSNATLHWVLDKESVVKNFYNSLKYGGRLVLEMGGKGNVERMISAISNGLSWHHLGERMKAQQWYFPSIGEYTTLLEQAGFHVEYAFHFDRPTELHNTENGIKDWVRMFGKSFLDGLDETTIENILEDVQESLASTQFKNNKWYADYKRLRIVAKKKQFGNDDF